MNNSFISFSSGSAGNCYYIKSAYSGKAILLEAGVSLSSVCKTLKQNNHSLESIQAVFVTHGHNDHVRHLSTFCEYLHIPVYMASKVRLSLNTSLVEECLPYVRTFAYGDELDVADFHIKTFEVPHDVPNTGYFISTSPGDLRLAFLTDIGHETPVALEAAKAATSLVVEADYDKEMLLNGNYPQLLKDRILSGGGHFSNENCAEFIKKCYHSGLKSVFLCHLSGNNNTPQLAYSLIREAIAPVVGNNALALVPLSRYKAMTFNI